MDFGTMISLAEINEMVIAEFEKQFGDIAENSPWVAALAERPFTSRSEMIKAFGDVVLKAKEDKQLALLRAHPDLATRAKLTTDSTNEQKGAGLYNLSADEFAKFTALNNRYKEQNGFPFIFAVKGATKHQILENFEKRIHHSKQEEFKVALQQVCRIIGFRLESRVSE
jgi:2-oxo-4-hydroxy-4-carboxy-5-ureidoimidazoline decarboxylase